MGDKNFAWPVTTVCKYDLKAFEMFLQNHGELLRKNQIVIFGAGIRGTQYSLFLKKFGYNNIIFTDNNVKKVGGWINEFSIVPFEKIIEKKEGSVILVSVENGISICEQLKEHGFIENRQFFYIDNHLYDNYIKMFCDTLERKVLLMGDCGITDLAIKDEDQHNLGEMIEQKLGRDKIKILAIHAMGMRAYYTIFKAHCRNVYKPNSLVLMVNMEVFTGKQHLLPRSQHAKLIELINQAVNGRESELVEYMEVTKERFANFMNDYFTSSDMPLNEMNQQTNEKIIMKMNYMFRMDTESECVVYLKKIIQLCKEEYINLLLFLPPTNYEFANELWGDLFQEKYKKNTEILIRIAEDANVEIVDFSYLLSRDGFADRCTIDETLNQSGRAVIANELVKRIKEKRMV